MATKRNRSVAANPEGDASFVPPLPTGNIPDTVPDHPPLPIEPLPDTAPEGPTLSSRIQPNKEVDETSLPLEDVPYETANSPPLPSEPIPVIEPEAAPLPSEPIPVFEPDAPILPSEPIPDTEPQDSPLQVAPIEESAPQTKTIDSSEHVQKHPRPDEDISQDDDGWEAVWDQDHGTYYFYNRFTDVKTWENPRVPPPKQEKSLAERLADDPEFTKLSKVERLKRYQELLKEEEKKKEVDEQTVDSPSTLQLVSDNPPPSKKIARGPTKREVQEFRRAKQQKKEKKLRDWLLK